jgi:hypothetical protein
VSPTALPADPSAHRPALPVNISAHPIASPADIPEHPSALPADISTHPSALLADTTTRPPALLADTTTRPPALLADTTARPQALPAGISARPPTASPLGTLGLGAPARVYPAPGSPLDRSTLTHPCDLIDQGPLDHSVERAARDHGPDDLAGAELHPAAERAGATAQTMRTPALPLALPLDAELRIADGGRGQWYSGCADDSGNGGLR